MACISQNNIVVDIDDEISVLDMGVKFNYKVPSFSVLHVDLSQIKLQLCCASDSVIIVDGFIRAGLSLENMTPPFSIKLKEFCFVPVSYSLCSHLLCMMNTMSYTSDIGLVE